MGGRVTIIIIIIVRGDRISFAIFFSLRLFLFSFLFYLLSFCFLYSIFLYSLLYLIYFSLGGTRGIIWGVLRGATAPLKTQVALPKPQLAPHIPQAPRSNSSWFSIIPTEIQMCHHFNITFSYILYVFFWVFFVTKTGP